MFKQNLNYFTIFKSGFFFVCLFVLCVFNHLICTHSWMNIVNWDNFINFTSNIWNLFLGFIVQKFWGFHINAYIYSHHIVKCFIALFYTLGSLIAYLYCIFCELLWCVWYISKKCHIFHICMLICFKISHSHTYVN